MADVTSPQAPKQNGPGFNLTQIVAQIGNQGLMRTNKFLIQFPPPPALQRYSVTNLGNFLAVNRNLQFWCEGANIPGIAINTEDVRRYGYGPSEKRPVNPVYSDLNLTFRGDAEGQIWNFLHTWLRIACLYESATYNNQGGLTEQIGAVRGQYPYEVAYKVDYMVDVGITAYDDMGNPGISVICREAWPLFIGDTPMNWGEKSEYQRIPVTMTYFDWYSTDFVATAGGGTQDAGTPQPTGTAVA